MDEGRKTLGDRVSITTQSSLSEVVINKSNHLIKAVIRYRALSARLIIRLRQEDPRTVATYLGLSLNNYNDKRRGEKAFQYADIIRLSERYGSDSDRADLQAFLKVRDGLYSWLQMSPIPPKEYQRIIGVHYQGGLVRRGEHPDTWKLDELERIGSFLAGTR